MKIKSIRISLLILFGLVILSYALFSSAQEQSNTSNNIFIDTDQDGLSDEEEQTFGTDPKIADTDGDSYSDGAEVRSGYNPLLPAPADRVLNDETVITNGNLESDQKNLTSEVAMKLSEIANESDPENQEITLEEIKGIVEKSLSGEFEESELPEISEDDIKIKDQNYKKLSKAEKEQQKKDDFIEYVVSASYIISSNSPVPITSDTDLTALSNELMINLNSVFMDNDMTKLNDLADSGQKIFDQMKEIEVPEDMTETHIDGLRFAAYAVSLKDNLVNSQDDPLSKIATLSKIQALMGELTDFMTASEEKFISYGLQSDNTLDEKLDSLNILPLIPQIGDSINDNDSSDEENSTDDDSEKNNETD